MEIKYEFLTTEELFDRIDFDKPLMYDSETIGFYGRIRLAQFYQRGWSKAIMVEWPNPFELTRLLQGAIVVAHNIHFDITTIQEQLGCLVWMPEKMHCTFMLARLYYYTKDSFSLDNVISYVLGESPYGETKKDMQKSDWSVPVLSDEQKHYAALDVICLHDVWDTVNVMQDDINYKLDMLTIKYCLDFQNNGMPLDLDNLNARYGENMKEINAIALPVNCNSPKQVREYINSTMSDDEGLAVLISQGNKRAEDVRKTRKLTKNNSFLTKFLNTMRDGVIYGKFKLSPRSGRLSSDDQNLQQIPRVLKYIFGVPEDGDEVIMFSDFAQIQLRAVCVVTADRTMEKLFRAGEDLHNFVARMIFGDSFTKEHRQICKTANFALLFGAGITVFIKILLTTVGLVLSDHEAGSLKKRWLGLWVQIKQWQDRGISDWKKGKAWQTPLGRRYVAKLLTDQLAMQIQGFEAEVAKLALHYMYPKMKELNKRIPDDMPKMRLRNFVHDCYLWTAPNDPAIYEEASQIMADAMQEAWKEMCQNVAITDLPMPVKVRIGWNWGAIEKGEELGDGYIYELNV